VNEAKIQEAEETCHQQLRGLWEKVQKKAIALIKSKIRYAL
jgi:hypothetical protein